LSKLLFEEQNEAGIRGSPSVEGKRGKKGRESVRLQTTTLGRKNQEGEPKEPGITLFSHRSQREKRADPSRLWKLGQQRKTEIEQTTVFLSSLHNTKERELHCSVAPLWGGRKKRIAELPE